LTEIDDWRDGLQQQFAEVVVVLVDTATIVVTHVFRRRRSVVSKMAVLVLNECGFNG
jgi:hypothetical protein